MARRKKLLYPGLEEVEQERRKAEKRYEQERKEKDINEMSYDEYQKYLVVHNID